MKKLTIFILFFFLVVSSREQERPNHVQLVFVETSDVHGAIFNYDFINDKPSKGSLAQVTTYLNDLRKNNKVILMDNGDILQGQPVVYYYNYIDTTDTHICAKVMNYLKYDVATIGNHDIEAGHSVYDKLTNEYNFPVLAANAVKKSDGQPYFEPYKILYRDGIKIAVLGLITPGVPDWLPEELWKGIEFKDMVETAKKWVPIILEKEKPDLLIGLFHSGYDYTYANEDYNTPNNENASRIVAEQVPGFDIIFVGHDHKTWNEKVKNIDNKEVIILGPKNSAIQVTSATVDLKMNKDGNYEKSIVGNIVEMSSYKPDSLFENKFHTEYNDVKNFVSGKVGEFTKTIYANDAIYGPSLFIDMINNLQLEISKAQISFAAPLSFNSVIKEGPVYVRDMFKLYRFENFLYTMNLTGKEIDNYLEYSYGLWFNTMSSSDDHLLLFETDDQGNPVFSEKNKSYSLKNNFYNFDVASGIIYQVDVSKENGNKVNIISLSNGNKFYEDSTYNVAINSYRGNGGGGHLTTGAGLTKDEILKRKTSSTEKDLRFYMMEWIEQNKIINPTLKKEWKVIPEDWWLKGKETDKKLLNKK